MTSRIVGGTLVACLLVGVVPPAAANEEAISQARTAALAWLGQLDARAFDETWQSAGELLRAAVTKEEWRIRISATLGPMGSVQSRKARSSEFSTTLPGAPDGEYVVLQFDTSFESKQKAVETVALRKEPDGLWRVSGYFIR